MAAEVASRLDDAFEGTDDSVAGEIIGKSGFPCGKGEELDVDKTGVAAAAVCDAVAEDVELAGV